MKKFIILWGHPRSRSTAFERFMIERKDFYVIHEPFSLMYDTNNFEMIYDGVKEKYNNCNDIIKNILLKLETTSIFLKETSDYWYKEVLSDKFFLNSAEHVILFRSPENTIASHYAINKNVTKDQIGYENLLNIVELVRQVKNQMPLIINSDEMVKNNEMTIKTFCEKMHIPFIDTALRWQKDDILIWERTQKWHLDAIESSGFSNQEKQYQDTVYNNDKLKEYYNYHLPFYLKLEEYKTKF